MLVPAILALSMLANCISQPNQCGGGPDLKYSVFFPVTLSVQSPSSEFHNYKVGLGADGSTVTLSESGGCEFDISDGHIFLSKKEETFTVISRNDGYAKVGFVVREEEWDALTAVGNYGCDEEGNAQVQWSTGYYADDDEYSKELPRFEVLVLILVLFRIVCYKRHGGSVGVVREGCAVVG